MCLVLHNISTYWLPLIADQNENGSLVSSPVSQVLSKIAGDDGGCQSFYGFILNEQDSKDTGVH